MTALCWLLCVTRPSLAARRGWGGGGMCVCQCTLRMDCALKLL